MAELLRVPPGSSRIRSNAPGSSPAGGGRRAERRNATGTGRQCDDGVGWGGCGGPPPAMAWRGVGVAGMAGVSPRSTGADGVSWDVDGGPIPMELFRRNLMRFARVPPDQAKNPHSGGCGRGGGFVRLIVEVAQLIEQARRGIIGGCRAQLVDNGFHAGLLPQCGFVRVV